MIRLSEIAFCTSTPPQTKTASQRSRSSGWQAPHTLLVEQYQSREGWHLYVHPFAGRNVHLGLASLVAWRLSLDQPNTFSLSFNDHGFELLAADPFDATPVRDGSVFSTRNLLHDVLASLNSTELAQRRFREIARVAGLVFSGYPGAPKSLRQVQASSRPMRWYSGCWKSRTRESATSACWPRLRNWSSSGRLARS